MGHPSDMVEEFKGLELEDLEHYQENVSVYDLVEEFTDEIDRTQKFIDARSESFKNLELSIQNGKVRRSGLSEDEDDIEEEKEQKMDSQNEENGFFDWRKWRRKQSIKK